MENLQKCIHGFYKQVEVHESKLDDITKKISKPCHSILNQSTILRALVPENSLEGTAFVDFPGFKAALINKIIASLDKELILLNQSREKICQANEELYQKQQSLERLFHELKSTNSLDYSVVNPSCPALEHIVDWSVDIWRYYHVHYLQVSQATKTLNYEDEESVFELSGSFQNNIQLKKHINIIRSLQLDSFNILK